MHPLQLTEIMAVHASTAKEEDMPQAQMLQYNVEASARCCPATRCESECYFQYWKPVM